MNRAERRKIIKDFPGYKKALKSAAGKAVDDLENMFKKQWEQSDATLNEGRDFYRNDDREDDLYND